MFLSPSAFAQSEIDCDLLPGNWSGEHTDSAGNYSRWDANYASDGKLELVFFEAAGTQVSVQQGTWGCDAGTLSTVMMSGSEIFEFDYQILSLDQDKISYQSQIDETVFHSSRVER